MRGHVMRNFAPILSRPKLSRHCAGRPARRLLRRRRHRADARSVRRQDGDHVYRLRPRRRLRPVGARGRPPYRRASAGQSDRKRAKPGRRRQLPRRQFHLQRGAQGRHRHGADRARRRARAADRRARRAIRRHQILLARHAGDRDQCVHRLSHLAGEDRAGSDAKRARRRRQRARHRHAFLSDCAE